MIRFNKKALLDMPISNEEIKCFMVFNCPIAHPTAIIRASILRKYNLKYSNDHTHSEDYNLWSQLSEYSELTNTPQILLDYRVHPNQITGNNKLHAVKENTLHAIRTKHLRKLGILPTDEELKIHSIISNAESVSSILQLEQAEIWLNKIVIINKENGAMNSSYLNKIVLERWLRVCFNFYGGRKGLIYFLKSRLYKSITLPFLQKVELCKQIYYSFKRKN